MIARTPRIIAVVPEMTFVKYRIATATATSMRSALSREPMFFFIRKKL